MENTLSAFILSYAPMQVLRVLYVAGPCSIREVADLCALTPRGAQITLEKLAAAGLVQGRRSRKKLLYRLNMSDQDWELLDAIIKNINTGLLEKRAGQLSKQSVEAVSWIDETVEALSQAGKKFWIEGTNGCDTN